jgi:tRNA-(ms[2]io[6]A)-hydroxylase
VFQLAWHTPAEWVARVCEHPLALLSDHAHCELKAAASAQGLILRAPGAGGLVARMAEIAQEEMEHFARVVAEIHRRGGELAPVTENPYARGLLARASDYAPRTDLLSRLVVAGLIEARSLERFWLLAEHAPDRELAALYRALLPSEAAHRGLFFGLARELCGRAEADARIAELTAAEGELMRGLAFAPRMHSGFEPEVA